MVALIGASGSGKSTLIRAIAGLVPIDARDGAAISIQGTAMQERGRIAASAKTLRSRVGIVFQQFNLVPRLSVLTNVCLGFLGRIPAWRGTLGRFTRHERSVAPCRRCTVSGSRAALNAGRAVGRQQQRATPTLVQGAEILIADEPIASLDPSAAL
jgi:phosphonate transport system ATP-binding protein